MFYKAIFTPWGIFTQWNDFDEYYVSMLCHLEMAGNSDECQVAEIYYICQVKVFWFLRRRREKKVINMPGDCVDLHSRFVCIFVLTAYLLVNSSAVHWKDTIDINLEKKMELKLHPHWRGGIYNVELEKGNSIDTDVDVTFWPEAKSNTEVSFVCWLLALYRTDAYDSFVNMDRNECMLHNSSGHFSFPFEWKYVWKKKVHGGLEAMSQWFLCQTLAIFKDC